MLGTIRTSTFLIKVLKKKTRTSFKNGLHEQPISYIVEIIIYSYIFKSVSEV